MIKTYRRVPWLEIGGGVLASAVFLTDFYAAGQGVLFASAAGVSSLIGWRLALGTDATLAEAYADAKGLPPEVVARLMDGARAALDRIRRSEDSVSDGSQKALMADIVSMGASILDQLRSEPAKLPSSSRFLQVYLEGAATVSEKFTALRSRGKPDTDLRFTEFLTRTKEVCAKQQLALTADDQFNLDVEIDVLQRRMNAEKV